MVQMVEMMKSFHVHLKTNLLFLHDLLLSPLLSLLLPVLLLGSHLQGSRQLKGKIGRSLTEKV